MDDKSNMGDLERRRKRLLEVLRAEPGNEDCERCLSRLDEYVAAQLAGEDYVALFADVALHLDLCVDCAVTYSRLYELEAAVEADRLIQMEDAPAPDLSFLDRSTTRLELLEQLRDSINWAGEQIILHFTAGLFPLLQPSPLALRGRVPGRAPVDSQIYGKVLMSLEPNEVPDLNLPVSVTAYEHLQQAGTCLVEVVVKQAGQSWPDLGGRTVELFFAGTSHRGNTDAWGVVSFEGIPVGALTQMRIEVTLTE